MPPTGRRLRDVVGSVDSRVDEAFGRVRGRPAFDAAATLASALGDHGLVWFLIGLARGRDPRYRRGAVRAIVLTGLLAPLVTQALKGAVNRERPAGGGDGRRLPVRVPRSASFPSGHALAAWSAATLLAEDDPLGPLYYALAGAISLSRIHVDLHHGSDVVAGSLIGAGMGYLGRVVAPGSG